MRSSAGVESGKALKVSRVVCVRVKLSLKVSYTCATMCEHFVRVVCARDLFLNNSRYVKCRRTLTNNYSERDRMNGVL